MSNIHALSPVDFPSYPTGSTESINPDNSTGQQYLLIGNTPEGDIRGIRTPAIVPPISERDSSGGSPHIEGQSFSGDLTPVHSRLRLRGLRQPLGEESSGETGATRNEYEPPQQHHVSGDQGGSKEEEDGETEKTTGDPPCEHHARQGRRTRRGRKRNRSNLDPCNEYGFNNGQQLSRPDLLCTPTHVHPDTMSCPMSNANIHDTVNVLSYNDNMLQTHH